MCFKEFAAKITTLETEVQKLNETHAQDSSNQREEIEKLKLENEKYFQRIQVCIRLATF